MDKKILNLDRNPQKSDRPYFIIPDNVKSNYSVDPIGSFPSINEILKDSPLRKIFSDKTYYRTDYLNKQIIKYKSN